MRVIQRRLGGEEIFEAQAEPFEDVKKQEILGLARE
jgi:hypothetical protein